MAVPAIAKSKWVLAALIVLAVGVAAAAGAVGWAWQRIHAPGPLDEARTYVVPRGAGLRTIARGLEEAGILAERRLFLLYARYRKAHRSLQAGEFEFPARASTADVLDMLVDGKPVLRFVTIPEGLTSREAVALIEAADGLTGTAEVPPEGSLLPETYTYSFDDDRAALLARMQDAMQETLAGLWEKRAGDLPFETPEEAVILASIVEKETGVPEERPRVAAVFVNRLRKGMRLQSDPTVIFALTRGERELERPLRFKDLEVDDPYNTYRIKGLPPAPICNPGRASLEAVLNPIETEELYFVADGNGGHVFARTLAEHNRNVAEWRKVQREQRRKARQQERQQQQ